jgi:hypothetical protein
MKVWSVGAVAPTPMPSRTAVAAPLLFLHVALVAAAPVRASAQAELITGLGGEAGFGTGVLEGNDDGSSAEIDITPAFPDGLPYFGQTYRSIFVNNNGSITFGGATGTFTPMRFPLTGNRMIAPFWADVDTRTGGRPGRNGVYWDIRPGQLVVTWHRVGFYPNDDSRQNTFQLVIISNAELDLDNLWRVEFRYRELEWTTGGASGGSGGLGGSPAQAGFDAGDGQTFRILPGSGSRAVLRLARDSNIGVPGLWLINIYQGTPQAIGGQDQTFDFSGGGAATGGAPRTRRPRR